METDRSDVSDKAEREEREREAGRKKAVGEDGRWRGMTSPSFLPSFPQQEKRNWPMRRETSEGRVMMGAPKVAGSFLVFYANFVVYFFFR